MWIVECIDDKFEWSDKVKTFIDMGEPTPKKGERYNVVGTGFDHNTGYNGYQLEGFDWRELGIILCFNKEKFKTIEHTFEPNHVTEDGQLVETINMVGRMTYNIDQDEIKTKKTFRK